MLSQVIGSIISGSHKHILFPHCRMLRHFHPDTVDQSLLAHRLYDPGCTKDRDTANNSQTGIEGLSGYFFPFRNRDRHLESALIVIPVRDFLYCL